MGVKDFLDRISRMNRIIDRMDAGTVNLRA
jgi:hypothetical protein